MSYESHGKHIRIAELRDIVAGHTASLVMDPFAESFVAVQHRGFRFHKRKTVKVCLVM